MPCRVRVPSSATPREADGHQSSAAGASRPGLVLDSSPRSVGSTALVFIRSVEVEQAERVSVGYAFGFEVGEEDVAGFAEVDDFVGLDQGVILAVVVLDSYGGFA